jgi:hypothetical protein
MKPRTLGYAVLFYAVLTSGSLFSLGEAIWQHGSDRWLTIAGVAPWLGYVSGGLGLIYGLAWSRMVLLITSGVMTVVGILGAVVSLWIGIPFLAGIAMAALSILPAVAIFVGAQRLRPPEAREIQPSPAPVTRKAGFSRIDLAYGCFAWIAFAVCAMLLSQVVLYYFPSQKGLEILVLLNFGVPTLAAALAAMVLSVVHWREWPLLIMTAISGSMLLVFFAQDKWKLGEGVGLAWFAGCATALVFFCARWFAFTRRRTTQAQQTGKLEV